ncbi:RNA-binding protein pno1 [Bienertia sinuspersici]
MFSSGSSYISGDMTMELPTKPKFDPIKPQEVLDGTEIQYRFIPVPQHRYAPLKKSWKTDIYEPIRNDMKIDIRINLKARQVELKTMPHTPDISNLDKCHSYVEAFMAGFDAEQIKDTFLKYDHFYLSTFNMNDVKRSLKGDHLARAIGRVCGKGGRTKFMIENATKTRIVVAAENVHIVGSFEGIKVAKDCVCRLVLGSPIGKIQSRLRTISTRASERF